jgi:hypothetical protein
LGIANPLVIASWRITISGSADGRRQRITRSETRERIVKLEMENGFVQEDPSAAAIAEALSTLGAKGGSFAILGRDDMTYIQASGSMKDGCDLEYQEGSLSRHFRATNASISLQEVIAAFQDYAAGGSQWQSRFQWEAEKKSGCLGVLLLVIVAAVAGAFLLR